MSGRRADWGGCCFLPVVLRRRVLVTRLERAALEPGQRGGRTLRGEVFQLQVLLDRPRLLPQLTGQTGLRHPPRQRGQPTQPGRHRLGLGLGRPCRGDDGPDLGRGTRRVNCPIGQGGCCRGGGRLLRLLRYEGLGVDGSRCAPSGFLGCLGYDDLVRDEHDRGRAAVRRGAQGHRDAVPGGEPGDHEHAEPEVVGEGDHVELRGHRQLSVERGVVLLRHAEPAVLDLDDEPLGDHRGPYPDGARRGRVHGRVVDQLGQQVDHVGDRGRREAHLLLGVHLHPLVLGDFADSAAQDVDQGDRLGPAAARLLAADDDEVLLVAAQLACGGVQFVQAAQDLGVVVPALQLVELGELEVDQVLALPGDAEDDLLETLRVSASSTAVCTAVRCAVLNAWATWPSSSLP